MSCSLNTMTPHHPLQGGTHSFEGVILRWPHLPGKAVKLSFSTSCKTLSLYLYLALDQRLSFWNKRASYKRPVTISTGREVNIQGKEWTCTLPFHPVSPRFFLSFCDFPFHQLVEHLLDVELLLGMQLLNNSVLSFILLCSWRRQDMNPILLRVIGEFFKREIWGLPWWSGA